MIQIKTPSNMLDAKTVDDRESAREYLLDNFSFVEILSVGMSEHYRKGNEERLVLTASLLADKRSPEQIESLVEMLEMIQGECPKCGGTGKI